MKELWYVHKTKLLIGAGVFVLLCVLIWSRFPIPDQAHTEQQVSFLLDADEVEEIRAPVDTKGEPEVIEMASTELLVDVKGAVFKPGVYKMKPGDRVIDAVETAGGFLNDADTRKVNLASLLSDEMVIIVPQEGEEDEGEVLITTDISETSDPSDGKININSASAVELTALTGIGPAKAEGIIAYRTENGMFKNIEEIMNVTGIGEKSFEKLKDEITVAD